MSDLPNRAPYGRSPASPARPTYQGTTYYDQPALKASHYGWLVALYFWIGGIGGAGQVIAAIADWRRPRESEALVRAARYLGLVSSLASALLLILDLHTPRRFYNMLRIVRTTSPLSIGSWVLTLFGAATGLAALGQAVADLGEQQLGRRLARWATLPAALSGAVMSVYTGAVLAATATPLWSVVPRLLPTLFGASAVATATAALSLLSTGLGAPARLHHRLERLALLAGGVELVALLTTLRAWQRRGVDGPLRRPAMGGAFFGGALGAGIVAPLLIHAAQLRTGRRSQAAATLAALLTLAGGLALRTVLIFAGNASATRARDYFTITQPDENR